MKIRPANRLPFPWLPAALALSWWLAAAFIGLSGCASRGPVAAPESFSGPAVDDLQAINSPADGECACNDAATGAFEWLAQTVDTNANTECVGTTTYLDGEGDCDNITGAGTAAVSIGSPAAEEIDTAGTYEPIHTAWAEGADPDGDWTIQSSDYYCYGGAAALTAIVSFDFSVSKTEQAGSHEITFRFGQEQQSTLPMTDGDEFGGTYPRDMDSIDAAGLGSMTEIISLVQDDCIGIMATADTSTPTIQFNGGTMIVAPQ